MGEIRHLGGIDVVRGLAVLGVVAVHLGHHVPGMSSLMTNWSHAGCTGVQLFFVASAFTLLHSWAGRSGEPSPRQSFLVRRYFRIAPLYLAGMVLYAMLIPLVYRQPIEWVGIGVNGLLLNGLVPAWNNNIVPGGWSIGTEVLLYVMLALCAPWLMDRRRAWTAAGVTVAVTGGWFVLMTALGKPSVDYGFRYFVLPSQLMAFGLGAVLYTEWRHRTLSPRVGTAFWVSGAVLIAVAGALYTSRSWAYWPFLPGFALLVWGLLSVDLRNPLARALASIGQASYAIYIGHFLVVMMATKVLTRLPFVLDDRVFLVSFVVVVALSYGFARGLGVTIERPGQQWGRRVVKWVQSRRRAVVTAPAMP